MGGTCSTHEWRREIINITSMRKHNGKETFCGDKFRWEDNITRSAGKN
jgi:hypothetical protein